MIMTTEQRLILCVVLSMMVVFAFSYVNRPDESEIIKNQQQTAQDPSSQSIRSPLDPSVTQAPAPTEKTEVQEEEQQEESTLSGWNWLPQGKPQTAPKTVVVESELYRVQFTTHGAVPFSWELKQFSELYAEPRYLKLAAEQETGLRSKIAKYEFIEYKNAEENGENPIQMVNQAFAPGNAGLAVRWGKTNSDQSVDYTADQQLYKVYDIDPVDVRFSSEQNGMLIEKIFSFYPNKYYVDIELRITNQSGEVLHFDRKKHENVYDINWFGGVGNPSLRTDSQNSAHYEIDASHMFLPLESVESTLGSQYNELMPEYNRMAAFVKHDEPLNPDNIDWVGVGQKYFLAALIPNSPTKRAILGVSSTKGTVPDRKPFMGMRMQMNDTISEFAYSDTFRLYVGPMDEDELLTAEAGLEDAQQIFLKSFTGPIVYFMLGLLNFFYSIVPDYGISIIILTLLIKVLMLPLYQKQMVQMKKMQALQPQMNAIREKYKDDPQKLQKEQMDLFRRNKVNPLGGCLPILPTIPIFIALYATFGMAVELRGAEGLYGIISDLSRPDYAFFVPAFGFIIPINILPVAYCLLMLWSMSMHKMEGPNATMMKIMPLMFVFIFWSMASGVILYFVISIFIDVLQRKIIEKVQETDPPPAPAKA